MVKNKEFETIVKSLPLPLQRLIIGHSLNCTIFHIDEGYKNNSGVHVVNDKQWDLLIDIFTFIKRTRIPSQGKIKTTMQLLSQSLRLEIQIDQRVSKIVTDVPLYKLRDSKFVSFLSDCCMIDKITMSKSRDVLGAGQQQQRLPSSVVSTVNHPVYQAGKVLGSGGNTDGSSSIRDLVKQQRLSERFLSQFEALQVELKISPPFSYTIDEKLSYKIDTLEVYGTVNFQLIRRKIDCLTNVCNVKFFINFNESFNCKLFEKEILHCGKLKSVEICSLGNSPLLNNGLANKDKDNFMKSMSELMSMYAKFKMCVGQVKMSLTEEHVHFL
ncbi:unnamed protein product [Ambrosiozyma monospora]|uniref:Unnamed protein product n=1 Tax=Ambrosiozyma monospora TaxID=43982 RepID=A0A9W6YUY9_AMBMO|nr:unnamed protein product [Ambrosiozyma monospora]